MFLANKLKLPQREVALKGRPERMIVPSRHRVLDVPLDADFPGMQTALFAMGCFWGAEKQFWSLPGVVSTAAGYSAGFTPNPTYKEVWSGGTGHAETVRIMFDPAKLSYNELLTVFWENHDPTQGMRQGNDVGTQYRSGIYPVDAEQRRLAEASRDAYQARLSQAGYEDITTEIADATDFFFAEDQHQQYLARNPNGYCGLGGTGITCAVGLKVGTHRV